MVAGMQTCGLCGGSGRDIVTPETRSCLMCGGLGQVPEPVRVGVGGGVVNRGSDNSGCALALLSLLLFAGAVIVGAGYALSSEMLWNYWIGGSFTEHYWGRVAIYAALSLGAVALAARYFGFLAGAVIGMIPALPLYHATKGGVGFWFIVFHSEEDPVNNVATSWIALTGMIAIHCMVAWTVQRRTAPFLERLLRWHWIKTRAGMLSTISLVVVGTLAAWTMMLAINAF